MRRTVVEMLQAKGISHRRSCRLSGISRNTAKYEPSKKDEPLVARMEELATEHFRYGYPAHLGLAEKRRLDRECQKNLETLENGQAASAKEKTKEKTPGAKH
jgi:transcriptional regulator with XRE-family HTH domain